MKDFPQFPYASAEARTRAEIDLHKGTQAHFDPVAYPKLDDACPLTDLLYEIGRASARERGELHDAHDAIPDDLAPRSEGTLGEKTPLADRIRMLLAIIERQRAMLQSKVGEE